MKTKILYVLSSAASDTYLESALISIYSARCNMPDAHIVLLVDDLTDSTFDGLRRDLLNYISEKVVVRFDSSFSLKVRSRLLKTSMRKHIIGDFLYIDCDTLIADSLQEIDKCEYDVAAVLDGHIEFAHHPVKDIFIQQGEVFNYPVAKTGKYFSGGVMYVRDSVRAHTFFELWHQNYITGLHLGVDQDEPSLGKTNFEVGHWIQELPGEWNCQIRLGGLFMNNFKILHFWSKRNMPLSFLGSKDFLLTVKENGVEHIKKHTADFYNTFYRPLGLIANDDLHFNFSPLYEAARAYYLSEGNISYFSSGLTFLEKITNKKEKTGVRRFFMFCNRIIFRIELRIISLFERTKKPAGS